MEIAVVAGFAAFLGKYLEQQFNLTTTAANQLLGMSDTVCLAYVDLCLQSKSIIYIKFCSNQNNNIVIEGINLASYRYDSHPMCMSGHFYGRSFGKEAESVCSGCCADGHVGQPDFHSVLRVFSFSRL